MQERSRLRNHIEEFNSLPYESRKVFYDAMVEKYGYNRKHVKKFFCENKRKGNSPTAKTAPEPPIQDHLTGLKSAMGIGNEYNLPVSLEEIYKPYTLPSECRSILNISDIHLPFQSNQALSLALKHGINEQVDTVLLNGDVIDFYAISRFQKVREKRDLANELRTGREFFTTLRKLFKTQTIIFKYGNHEDRWQNYIANNAEDFAGVDDFQLPSVLRLNDIGIAVVSSKTVIHAGHLTILHGHELGKTLFSPVNPARGLYLRARASAVMGHCHQTSEHTGKDIRNKIITCWSQGCLSELNPDYAILNNFNHGFSHITMMSDGDFSLRNYRIMDNKVI